MAGFLLGGFRDSNGQSGGLPRTFPENMSVTYLSGGRGKSMFLLPVRRIPPPLNLWVENPSSQKVHKNTSVKGLAP